MAATLSPMAAPKAIDVFHLAFLAILPLRLEPARYILKGGANLRFFYESPRFSEDIDLDVRAPRENVEAAVDRALSSPALRLTLKTHDLDVGAVTKPKQTPTTQRWKVTLTSSRRPGGQSIRTEIEFSHRGLDDRYELIQVPSAVVEPYGLRPPTVQSYLPPAMILLKLRALVGRKETQTRDVFDLDLLFTRYPRLVKADVLARGTVDVDAAIERILELPFEAYASQVVPFLAPEFAELLGTSAAWTRMQEHLVEALTR